MRNTCVVVAVKMFSLARLKKKIVSPRSDVAKYLLPFQPWWGEWLRIFTDGPVRNGARKKFDIIVRGGETIDVRGSLIIVLNHKSDDDGVVALEAFTRAEGLRSYLSRIAFVSGEHVFEPGFLGGYLVRRPRWLSCILFQFTIGRFMTAMRAYPIVHARSRFLISHLYDVLAIKGNLALGEVFRDSPDRYLHGAKPMNTIRSVLGFRYRDDLYTTYDFPIFRPPLDDLLWQRQQERITSTIALFADLLDAGQAVMIAPEGVLSREGKPGRIRSGLSQIVATSRGEVTLVPVVLTYDPMMCGKVNAFVTVGEPMYGAKALSKEELNAEIAKRFDCLSPFTFSQIAAHILRKTAAEGRNEIDVNVYKQQILESARQLASQGRDVTPELLDGTRFENRWTKFEAYCKRTKGIAFAGSRFRFDPVDVCDDRIRENGFASRWTCCDNEFRTRISDDAKDRQPDERGLRIT